MPPLVPGAEGVVLDATLRYDPADPYAVKATFRAGDASVSWMLGRELLHRGLVDATGDGDVRVWPDLDADDEPAVMVRLSSPDGQAVLCLDADALQAFLARTFSLVPLGQEGAASRRHGLGDKNLLLIAGHYRILAALVFIHSGWDDESFSRWNSLRSTAAGTAEWDDRRAPADVAKRLDDKQGDLDRENGAFAPRGSRIG